MNDFRTSGKQYKSHMGYFFGNFMALFLKTFENSLALRGGQLITSKHTPSPWPVVMSELNFHLLTLFLTS